ncbi:MAG: ABC transporter permease [Anaerolineae bacterium]|nr:ABC transporter permease [Anaerolineae bacterium]
MSSTAKPSAISRDGATTSGTRLRRIFQAQEIGIFLVLLLMGAVLAWQTEGKFLDINRNLFNVLRAFSWIAISAFGQILVIITAGIDLSVGSTMALAGMLAALAMTSWGLPVVPGVIVGLLTGVAIGLLNGLLISKAKLPPFIATLGLMSIARGICYGVAKGQPVRGLPKEFNLLGQYDLPVFGFGVPLPVIVMFVLAIIMSLFLTRTVWGYRIYALGGNEQAAGLSGINTGRIKILVYTLCGLLTALGGLLMTARLGVAAPTAALGYELDVIAAVVIGGTSLAGGEGTILGVLIGAAIMQVLRNGLVLLGFDPYWQPAAIGMVIILAITLDQLRKRR